jgi:hypothetical protein
MRVAARAAAPAAATAPTYLNVFTVEEYESTGKTQKRWTKIGAVFPHKEGIGFNIELKAFPVDGRLADLPPAGRGDSPVSLRDEPAAPGEHNDAPKLLIAIVLSVETL